MKQLSVHWDLLLFISLAIGFIGFSEVDLTVSAWFYRTGVGFFLQHEPWADFIYQYAPLLMKIFAWGLGCSLLLGVFPVFSRLKKHRLGIVYLALVLMMGPGLLVNTLFKDQWGRARPAYVREFGGIRNFTPAFQMTDQCRRNCSFVSGHASLGFYFCALAFIDSRRRRFWLGVGISLGALVGFTRIVQGRHFLSDVVFAFYSVYFCAAILHFFLFSPASPLCRMQKAKMGNALPARVNLQSEA